jgi:hypothetical protein
MTSDWCLVTSEEAGASIGDATKPWTHVLGSVNPTRMWKGGVQHASEKR